MKINFSKFLSFSLAILMSISIMTSFSAFAADEADVLWVGGIEVTESNSADILGDKTASYDFETDTLTLKKADIKNGYSAEDGVFGIYCKGDLNIVLEDKSYITAPQSEKCSVGIFVMGDLSFNGGSLVVKAGNVSGSESLESKGIHSFGKITVDNAVVEALGGDIEGGNEAKASSVGIYALSAVEAKNDGHLAGYGGNINGGKTSWSHGIIATGDDKSPIYIAVREGGLLGHGGDVVAVEHAVSEGICATLCDIASFVVDSHMDFSGGNATATSDGYMTFAISRGANIQGGSFGADGGNIYISSKECKGGSYVENEAMVITTVNNANGIPTGGYFAVTAEEILSNPHSPQFKGTFVKLSSHSGIALKAECGIIIDESLKISVPKNGYEDLADDLSTYSVIKDENGVVANNVEISVLTYKVSINDASRKLAIPVPAHFNINDTYCEKFGIEDFSEYLITEKEGFVFEGWYADEAFTKEFSFDEEITSDITVYGKWTAVSDDSSEESSEENSEENEDAKPGDSGISVFFILLVLSFGAAFAVSKKRV